MEARAELNMMASDNITIVPERKMVSLQCVTGVILILAISTLTGWSDGSLVKGAVLGLAIGLIALAIAETRRRVSGISRLQLSDDGLTIERRGRSQSVAWAELAKAAHSTGMGHKWTLRTRTGEKVIVRDDGIDPDTWSMISEVFSLALDRSGGEVRADLLHELFVKRGG